MTTATYYKASLTLPIILPLLAFGGTYLAGERAGDGVESVAYLLLASLLCGGVPYVYTAYHLLRDMDRQYDTDGVEALVWAAPLRMLIPCVVFWPLAGLVLGAFNGQPLGGIGGGLLACLILSPFVLIFGYGYVVLVTIFRAVLRALRLVED
jgi:hypothetical protein